MSLTNKTIGGVFWAFLERFGAQILQMVIFIVLARLLAPKAFGLMGMLAIFVQLSQSLVDSGFGQALIQKKNTDEIDYSSVFFFNLIISLCLYAILYFSAPKIAEFYRESELINLIRVLGLQFIISAFSLVQIARLTKEVEFKKLMVIKLPSTLLGGTTGIIAAYSGFGVWSLVIYQLTDKLAYSVQIWFHSNWKPIWIIKLNRIKTLFDFGGKLMLEGLISTVYNNLYELLIGKYYSAAQVGFYTQAKQIKQIPVLNISVALERVTFPILSDIQEDDLRLSRAFQKIMRQVIFILSPLMIGGIVLAEPLFEFVLTEKWLPAAPYFQVLCISGLFYPLNVYNLNILKVKGRSDLYLYLGLVNKGISIIVIFFIVKYSVMALLLFQAIKSIIAYVFYGQICGKLIGYNLKNQFSDIWKFLTFSIVSGIFVHIILNQFLLSNVGTIIIGAAIGFVVYGLLIYIFEKSILVFTKRTIQNFNI